MTDTTEAPLRHTARLAADGLLYPNVYKPNDFGRDQRPKYGLLLPLGALRGSVPDDALRWLRASERDGVLMARASSVYAPEVRAEWDDEDREGDPVDELVHLLQRLDARNLPRDRVFQGCPVDVEVVTYDYTNPWDGSCGVGLGLRAVTVYL